MSGLVKEDPRSVVIRHVLVPLGNSLVGLINQRPEIEEFAAKGDSIVVGGLGIIRMGFRSVIFLVWTWVPAVGTAIASLSITAIIVRIPNFVRFAAASGL
jgi:hypothetical protein